MAIPENKLAFEGGWEYSPAPESTDHIKVKKRYGLFIDGDFVMVTYAWTPNWAFILTSAWARSTCPSPATR